MVSNLIVLVGSEFHTTVDGRDRAPVEVGSLSHFLQGFIHPRWCRISSRINSRSMNYKTPRYFVHHENPAIFRALFFGVNVGTFGESALNCLWLCLGSKMFRLLLGGFQHIFLEIYAQKKCLQTNFMKKKLGTWFRLTFVKGQGWPL